MLKRMMTVAAAAVLGLGITVVYADLASAREGFGPECNPPEGMRDGRGGGIIDRLDTDNDGKVSRAEYDAAFYRLDRDNDGYVTREEVSELRDEMRTERREEMLKRDDADGDGKVSREEFSGPPELFAKVDADHDGYITEQEALEFRPKRDGMGRGGRGGMDGGRGGMDGGRGGMDGGRGGMDDGRGGQRGYGRLGGEY